jgi:hypothetical protein
LLDKITIRLDKGVQINTMILLKWRNAKQMEELIFDYPHRQFKNFEYTKKDKQLLRMLAEKKAAIASLPVHREKIDLWEKLNGLEQVRPLVWINEIPWHEMDYEDELKLQTTTEFSQYLELRLRKTLYQWDHMRTDMIVESAIPCYIDHTNTWFGITEQVKIARTDKESEIYSREFTPQIKSEEDIDKIKMPRVEINRERTEQKYGAMQDIFDGILKVEKRGVPGFWFAPWDELIRWWDVQDALTDMLLRPWLVHRAMDRLTKAYLNMLDQYEDLNLLSLNNCNYRNGSGGLGYAADLPRRNYDPNHISAADLWGNGTAQIFSDVSPKMHVEFALEYEIQWMKRFGLNYYGCCEPLHKKIDILEKIPKLRKLSMSPWVNLDEGAERISDKYVFSYKPSPAIFTQGAWDPGSVHARLLVDIRRIRNCSVEIIMKDISTVKYRPQRLWEWSKIAMDVAHGFE